MRVNSRRDVEIAKGRSMFTNTADEAAVFQQIHELLEQQRQAKRRPSAATLDRSGVPRFETRSGPRRDYNCAQLLAPVTGRNPPSQTDFSLVQCRDISPGGFAYFADSRPTHDRIVVALGLAPFSFFVAKIVRIEVGSESTDPILVGCKFLHRLEPASA
jgi:hypothetical protein